jgi:exodeoxyribonuclease VII large subunit
VLVNRIAIARDRVADRAGRLAPALQRSVRARSERLVQAGQHLRPEPIRERLGRATRELERAGQRQIAALDARMTRLSDRLEALDRMRRSLGYKATLARGYAVVRKGGAVVTGAEAARGAALEIEFRDGRVNVKAEDGGSKSPPDTGSDQGSLF